MLQNEKNEFPSRLKWKGKPYNFFGDYLQNLYNTKVFKLPVNAGFSCPNRINSNGCIFCSEDGSASPSSRDESEILNQIRNAEKRIDRKNNKTKYIAYFQAYTNTFSPKKNLKQYYDKAIAYKNIIGLMIGTRPDCLPDDTLDLIASYNKKDFELWLEIGMQTSHNKSLIYLNRQHNNEDTISAIKRANKRNIKVCVHLILGIPGETWEDVMNTANLISKLPISGIKFHQLHVIENTELHNLYKKGNVPVLSLKEYVSTLCDFIERLREDILIHRLLGDRELKTLIAPAWGKNKGTVLNAIDDEFKSRGTWQGFLLDRNV